MLTALTIDDEEKGRNGARQNWLIIVLKLKQ